MATPPLTSCPLTPLDGYRLWADTYDSEANPMLTLERRILEPLLPSLASLDVVDLGCGTGRWLEVAKHAGVRSLLGVDLSPEMLGRARAKLADAARLICAPFDQVVIADSSADLVFCNFVLSYVEHPQRLFRLVANILRPGGFLFLSDVHPDTASMFKWRRGGGNGNGFQEICTHLRSLARIVELCRYANLDLTGQVKPAFGEPERAIFVANGKQEYFDRFRDRPAIYLLQLTKPATTAVSPQPRGNRIAIDHLHSARFALGPSDSVCGDMPISRSRLGAICSRPSNEGTKLDENALDLQGYLVLPGLINAHDHLEFALFPRLGRGSYRNFLEWAEDIHRSRALEIARHRQVPKPTRVWWGGIRNLLCGVTTVCHHNPYLPGIFDGDFIIRVLRDFDWAHSLSLEPDAAAKKKATTSGRPFFLHLAEGVDDTSAQEIFDLHRAGALDVQTVVIHGLGLNPEGRALLSSSGAGLIWCPSSNLFLFGTAMPAAEIRKFPTVALGSDSSLTACGDLLDELRCAHEILFASAMDLYDYVTCCPAQLLGLGGGEGRLHAGGYADLIAVRDTGLTPAETLSTLSCCDVELVLVGGRVQLASAQMLPRLPVAAREGLQSLRVEDTVRWIRAPLDQLFADTAPHLGDELYLGGKKVSLDC